MYEYLELLLHIAKKKGLFGSFKSSTLSISKELDISQQTISRKLREMEDKKLVKRLASPNGLSISLDNKGRDFLQKNYQDLKDLFKAKKTVINAIVQEGIGEGSYYVSQKQYNKQFRSKLGFVAFPGTLNLKVSREELTQFLANKEMILIEGFNTKTRTFGPINAYKIKTNNIESAIVVPERTRHAEDIIEVIANVNLRDALKIEDKDTVKLS
jgi:riboflavin kinase